MLPLADVRIVAIEQFGAGPWATLQLADLGAEVIKIEDPATGGDVGRYVPPFQEDEDSLFFETFNRNKKSISLDLRSRAGRTVFEDLVRRSDAVFSNLRGDQPKKLSLTYEDLKGVNERIVCCSLSGFGTTGPRGPEAGYDYVMQGLAGWMSLTGDPNGPPTKSGLSLVDFSAGYVAGIALLAGLWRARREAVGCDCDVSLFETALAELTYIGTWVASAGYEPQRIPESAHPSIVPFQSFATADGWMVIACPKQRFWERLCGAIDHPELAADARFIDFAGRARHRDELLAILRPILRSRSTAEWLTVFADAGVPSAPINTVAGALEDRQARARKDVVEVAHPRFGIVREVATPLRVAEEDKPLRRAPQRDEHRRELLADLCSYSDDRIRELEHAGAFGVSEAGGEADVDVRAIE
jgi:crotonobetainyl-CoA:carnitine CoA-transferase CaiB-like acyl-CoA transferase